jgi:hypothetical protein
MKHIPTFESFINEAKTGSMTIADFAAAWTKMYGENLKNDYYDVWKKLDKMKTFTIEDVVKVWDESYGEDFQTDYEGLYTELKK